MLSLVIYALVIVISIKYVAIVMRADNQGEGGILALTALIPSRNGGTNTTSRLAVGRPLLIALGIFGTALLYGDGMITPAISVLGAIEGLEVVTPLFGFMEDPDVPDALLLAREKGVEMNVDDLTYFLGRETIIVTRRQGMAIWREKLFVLMARNAVRATAFFRLPPERVVELGVQVEM